MDKGRHHTAVTTRVMRSIISVCDWDYGSPFSWSLLQCDVALDSRIVQLVSSPNTLV